MPSLPQRIVLDTNVCLDLFVFASPTCAPLAQALGASRVHAYTDAECRAEWCRVLAYPKLRLDAASAERALAAFDAALRLHPMAEDPADAALPSCRDPDDQKFLRLARRSAARVLITRDANLLRLSRRAQAVAGFAVLPPAEAVVLLELA